MSDDQHEDPPAVDDDANEPPGPRDYGPDPTIPSATIRTVSSLIDLVFAVFVYIVSLSLIGAVINTHGKPLSNGQKVAVSLGFVAISVIVFATLEHLGGTPGRRLTHLRLVLLDRTVPGWSPVLLRYLAVFVPLINIIGVVLVFVGVMMSGLQSQRRDAFDLLSRTRVVPMDQVVTDTSSHAA